MLLAAFERWERYGTLDAQPGDPASARLDPWLEDMRRGRAVTPPPSWLQAVLGALGLEWDARRPRVMPVPGAAGGSLAGVAGAGGPDLGPGVLGGDVVYAGAGGRVAGRHRALARGYAAWLGEVDPLRGRAASSRRTACWRRSRWTWRWVRGRGSGRARPGCLRCPILSGMPGRPLVRMADYRAVVAAVRAAGPGARGMVSVRAVDEVDDHVISVVRDERGRVVFLDGQAGRLAVLPAAPGGGRAGADGWGGHA